LSREKLCFYLTLFETNDLLLKNFAVTSGLDFSVKGKNAEQQIFLRSAEIKS